MNGLELYQDIALAGSGIIVAYLNGSEAAQLLYIIHEDELVVQSLETNEELQNSAIGAVMVQWLKEQNPGMVVDFSRISNPVELAPSTTAGYLPFTRGTVGEEAPRKHVRVVFGAYMPRPKHLLLSQRRLSQSFPGQWELPNGRVLENESDQDALKRAWRRKLGVEIEVEEKLVELDYIPASDVVMDIVIYTVCLPTGVKPRPLDSMGLKVVSLKEAEELAPLISVTATLDILAGKQ